MHDRVIVDRCANCNLLLPSFLFFNVLSSRPSSSRIKFSVCHLALLPRYRHLAIAFTLSLTLIGAFSSYLRIVINLKSLDSPFSILLSLRLFLLPFTILCTFILLSSFLGFTILSNVFLANAHTSVINQLSSTIINTTISIIRRVEAGVRDPSSLSVPVSTSSRIIGTSM